MTLPDGSTQKVLAPQVYLLPRTGDLKADGTLIAGQSLTLRSGELSNSGTVAGRTLLDLSTHNLQNLGGRLSGNAVKIAASGDLTNLGGRIEAGESLALTAGRDIILESTTATGHGQTTDGRFSRTQIDRVAGLYVSGANGSLSAIAGRNLTLNAAEVVNAGSGATTLAATQDLSLGTVTTRDSTDIGGGRNRARVESSRDVGSRLRTQGDASLLAGNNLSGRAVDLAAEGNLALAAGRDVVLAAGRNEQSVDIASYASGKSGGGLMGGKKVTRSMEIKAETSTAQEGALSGKNVSIQAGRDIALEGGLYAARQTLALEAGRDLTLAAASDQVQASLSQSSKSGAKVKQQSEQRSSNMANGAVLVAGSDLSLKSSGDTTLVGSGLAAGGQITVKTGGDLALVAAQSDRQVQGSDYQQGKRKAVTHTREESETRQLLSTITAGGQVAIDVGGNFSAEIGEKNADGSLRADRMTATGIDQGDSRQQVRITGSGSGGSTLAETAKKALAEGIRAEADDAFTPGVTRTGTAALNQFLESGLVKVGNIPQLERQLKQILGDGAGLTQRDATGQITLTVAGQSKVQEVYNALKLTEHFDVKKFPDGQTAQLVTLVVAIALTICTAGAGAASLGAVAASAMGATATTAISATFAAGVINAAAIGMASTMIGQLAGGASFDQAFKAGVKAAATSAVTAGVTYGIGELVNAVPTNSVSGSTVQVGTNAATPGSNAFQAMTTPQYWAQTGLNALAKGAISQAQGGKFADGVVGSVIGSFAASGAGIIGDMTQGNTLANMISHAVLGCAVAAAGKQDCASGALGGASSALIARAIGSALPSEEIKNSEGKVLAEGMAKGTRDAIIAAGSITGASLLTGALGGDRLTAGNAAANEVTNNYLKHSEAKALSDAKDRRQQCGADSTCRADADQEIKALQDLDRERNNDLRVACQAPSSNACSLERSKLADAVASYAGKTDGLDKWGVIDTERRETITLANQYTTKATQLASVLRSAGELALDVSPAGDVKALLEANTKLEYALALVGALGPAGDLTKALVKEAKVLLEAGDIAKARGAEKIAESEKSIAASAGSKNNWDRVINGQLEPKAVYKLDNGHQYITDALPVASPPSKVNYRSPRWIGIPTSNAQRASAAISAMMAGI